MFQQVYFHKAARAAEWMIRAILARAAALIRRGVGLPGDSRARSSRSPVAGRPPSRDYLELDDGVLWGAMHAWESSHDPHSRRSPPARARPLALQDARALRHGRCQAVPPCASTSLATSPKSAGSCPELRRARRRSRHAFLRRATTRSPSSSPAADAASRATCRSCSDACATKRSPHAPHLRARAARCHPVGRLRMIALLVRGLRRLSA